MWADVLKDVEQVKGFISLRVEMIKVVINYEKGVERKIQLIGKQDLNEGRLCIKH